ncbi:MAG: ABC transporter permease [Anaerolineae bacterium]|jgi:ABC-type dipeptide/oligopeptide/nickel transport system permease component
MLTFTIRRLFSTILVLWGVVTLTFFAIRLLPGDPATLLISQGGGSAEDIAKLREQLGLNDPVPVQYLRFLARLVQGDLGMSLVSHRPVADAIREQLPHTLALATTATLVSVIAGMSLGILAATHQRTWIDQLCIVISVVGVSVPILLSGLLLILLFSLVLGWLPATGQGTWRHLVMPSLVLSLASLGTIARLVRTQMLEVLPESYITVARAKGVQERAILWRHALRNALIPVITIIGLQFGALLGGTVVTESLFSRRGLGRLVVDAIFWKDYPLVQGVVILGAAIYVGVNFLVDMSYGLLDPRVRRG